MEWGLHVTIGHQRIFRLRASLAQFCTISFSPTRNPPTARSAVDGFSVADGRRRYLNRAAGLLRPNAAPFTFTAPRMPFPSCSSTILDYPGLPNHSPAQE